MKRNSFYIFLLFVGLISSCENEKIPAPFVAGPTTYIKSVYTNLPVTINSAIWNNADYYLVPLSNLKVRQIDTTDGILNVNGTYNGLSSFGKQPVNLIIKSVYTNNMLYILATWNDTSLNPANKRWMWNGTK